MTPDPGTAQPRAGLWLIGGRGAISTCVVHGLFGLDEGHVESVGLLSADPRLAHLGLRSPAQWVLSGSEVRSAGIGATVAELHRQHILPGDLIQKVAGRVAAYDQSLSPGLLDAGDRHAGGLAQEQFDPRTLELINASPRERIAHVVSCLGAFKKKYTLERIVVVNLASSERYSAAAPAWASLSALDAALDRGEAQPASLLYAYAAFQAGAAFVNFTPSTGATPPALEEFARARHVPHCGNDGKTGETLVKTALAPMFAHRRLRVLAWAGYNMLGNRDGAVLEDPEHKRAKLRNKDEVLKRLLDAPELTSRVGIDFVPSLGDWKTAMDFVHFEGFLGARMSLQFTWTGSDSALAAPLVIDLACFAERALRDRRAGHLPELACYFKSPIGASSDDFHLQMQALYRWAEGQR
jgi:myo-inositol-1-phosphate synthase